LLSVLIANVCAAAKNCLWTLGALWAAVWPTLLKLPPNQIRCPDAGAALLAFPGAVHAVWSRPAAVFVKFAAGPVDRRQEFVEEEPALGRYHEPLN
jgi:hypothetical protein